MFSRTVRHGSLPGPEGMRETGEAIARDLINKLAILPDQLIEEAYIDLLIRKSKPIEADSPHLPRSS